MCIIVIKEKGHSWPSSETIKNCATNNPDGFSMAWNDKGKLFTYQSLVMEDFLKKYESVKKLSMKKTACILHCRIKTHGSLSVKNCHCWESDGIAFAHNGILSMTAREDMTDSETFFRDIFIPVYRYGGWESGERAVTACIGSSKFAFINGDGKIWSYGKYEIFEGLKFSNSSYIAVKAAPVYRWSKNSVYGYYGKRYNTTNYGGYYDSYDDYGYDDYDYDWRDTVKKNEFGDYSYGKSRFGNEIYKSRKTNQFYTIICGKVNVFLDYDCAKNEKNGKVVDLLTV
jgi:hypothetical protein